MLSDDAKAIAAARAASTRNMAYSIYDKATGSIVLSGTAGSPKSLNAKIQPGQGVMFDVALDGRTHFINPKTGRVNKRRDAK